MKRPKTAKRRRENINRADTERMPCRSNDCSYLRKLQDDIRLHEIIRDAALHSLAVEEMGKIRQAVADSRALISVIERPKPKIEWRRSYAFESWVETIMINRKRRFLNP